MNEKIAAILANQYIQLGFISKSAGCVQEYKKHSKEAGTKTFPIARTYYRQTPSGEVVCPVIEAYEDVAPNTSEIGIIYFEDLGSRVVKSNARMDTWKGNLKLVCWLNLKKIGEKSPGILQDAVMNHLTPDLEADPFIFGGKLKFTETYPKRPSPFDKYSYDEKQTQHLVHPFDYFSLKVSFTIYAAKNCPLFIELNPIVC